ncbi:B-cell antigen receptor complex-associated protein alpha chain [Plectropomus leopardus]|uniref:B-cell antigen receptor complex-associated protein alpha chain n=1 Tax=Plectropomus leopardus TaxID=160734 RepID=UPI001C4A7BB7|nr:B-cell antigen receptor complex-associated protein alpha chain [Plectropomus leopardus]
MIAMGTVTNFLLCSFVVGIAQSEVILHPDKPFERVKVLNQVKLRCCYSSPTTRPSEITWIKRSSNKTQALRAVELSDFVIKRRAKLSVNFSCSTLTFQRVQLEDTGMYQCWLNDSKLLSHGTYLQVYKHLEKTLNLKESTKNKILTAEGVLLLLCVLGPSITFLFKSKRLNQLEKKKVKKEEENIYQGLNLDECWSTYDQIERAQTHGPYQDVGNVKEEEEPIQLEKP